MAPPNQRSIGVTSPRRSAKAPSCVDVPGHDVRGSPGPRATPTRPPSPSECAAPAVAAQSASSTREPERHGEPDGQRHRGRPERARVGVAADGDGRTGVERARATGGSRRRAAAAPARAGSSRRCRWSRAPGRRPRVGLLEVIDRQRTQLDPQPCGARALQLVGVEPQAQAVCDARPRGSRASSPRSKSVGSQKTSMKSACGATSGKRVR